MRRTQPFVAPSAAPLAPDLNADANLGTASQQICDAQNGLILSLLVCVHDWHSYGDRGVSIQPECQVVRRFAVRLNRGVHDSVYTTLLTTFLQVARAQLSKPPLPTAGSRQVR